MISLLVEVESLDDALDKIFFFRHHPSITVQPLVKFNMKVTALFALLSAAATNADAFATPTGQFAMRTGRCVKGVSLARRRQNLERNEKLHVPIYFMCILPGLSHLTYTIHLYFTQLYA
jgi:hypothetical protein